MLFASATKPCRLSSYAVPGLAQCCVQLDQANTWFGKCSA